MVGQESVRQGRRLALDVLVRRRERADGKRRLNGLAVERLTALGERDSAMRDTRAACRRGAPSDPLSRQLVHATSSGQAGGDSQPSSFNNRSISASAAANDAPLCAAYGARAATRSVRVNSASTGCTVICIDSANSWFSAASS